MSKKKKTTPRIELRRRAKTALMISETYRRKRKMQQNNFRHEANFQFLN